MATYFPSSTSEMSLLLYTFSPIVDSGIILRLISDTAYLAWLYSSDVYKRQIGYCTTRILKNIYIYEPRIDDWALHARV